MRIRVTDQRPPPPVDELPEALPDQRRRMRLPYVWILPAIVIVAGAFVAVHEKLAEGVPIEITFRTADDLEPNKTKISYKAVEIGQVKEIRVSKDRKNVVVEARIHRDAGDYLVQDTRFWVVRPARDRNQHLRPGHSRLGRLHQRRCGTFVGAGARISPGSRCRRS